MKHINGIAAAALWPVMIVLTPTMPISGQNTFPFPSSGNVGIGTTAPAAPLDVWGGIDLNGTNGIKNPPASGVPDTSSISIGAGALPTTPSPGSGGSIGIGASALANGPNGEENIGIGNNTLYEQSSGNKNTAVGYDAGVFVYSGSYNTALGEGALFGSALISGSANVAIGYQSLTHVSGAGTSNVGLGASVGSTTITTGSQNILIGVDSSTDTVTATTNNSMNIGNAIYGKSLYNNTNNGSLTSGLIGINTATPANALDVSGSLAVGTYAGTATGASNELIVGGKVGIGTTSPVHPLQVAGIIGAEEVIVSANGADYVFDSNYHLAPLADVANYVGANHHLPDIPSAAEVREKGMSLGEMQSKLLAKIEELTLHMIDAEKDRDLLMQQNRELQSRVDRLEAATTAKTADQR